MSCRRVDIRLLTSAAITALVCSSTAASTVLPMSVQELADAAGQIIDGVVESTDSVWSENHTTIRTTVRFRQVNYLKGALPGSSNTFELVVPGGSVGEVHLRVTGAPHFEVGQRWLLFVHPTYNVHPVVGIYWGAFRIDSDAYGRLAVGDATGGVVIGMDEGGFVRSIETQPQTQRAPQCVLGNASRSVVDVVSVKRDVGIGEMQIEHMTYDRFLERLRPIIEASTAYQLTEPAGRPRGERARGVPLRIRNADGGSQGEVVHPAAGELPSRRSRVGRFQGTESGEN